MVGCPSIAYSFVRLGVLLISIVDQSKSILKFQTSRKRASSASFDGGLNWCCISVLSFVHVRTGYCETRILTSRPNKMTPTPQVASPGVTWRDLEAELKILGEIQRGDRLRVMNIVKIEPATNRWATALARWVAGEGRAVTIRWLADLRTRVDCFCTSCKEEAKRFALMGEGSTSFSGDACPQCLRVRCACTLLGLLRALDADLERAVDGVTRLSLTYASDPATQTSIFAERDQLRRLRTELAAFLAEHEG